MMSTMAAFYVLHCATTNIPHFPSPLPHDGRSLGAPERETELIWSASAKFAHLRVSIAVASTNAPAAMRLLLC
jgi:hypothetical protein